MTNDTLNTANLTNDAFSQKSLKWNNTGFVWDNAQGKWVLPENFKNDTLNIATLTNDALS